MYSFRCIFTSFTSSFQLANVVSLKYIVFNLSQCARAYVSVPPSLSVHVCARCVCVCVCVVCVNVCVCVVGYACGVMQNGVNMPLV